MDTAVFSALIPNANSRTREQIGDVLASFGEPVLSYVARAGITIHALRNGEEYKSVSPALGRLGIDVDACPAPPAGLFVVEERRVYLRSLSPMTIAHEFAHGFDCALGGGVYRSGIDPDIRTAFASARTFVTPYAATGIDEYFAESVRAFIGANDPASAWPPATSERLRKLDPAMSSAIERILAALP